MPRRFSRTKFLTGTAVFLASFYTLCVANVRAEILPSQKPFAIVINGIEGAAKENVDAMLAIPEGMIRNGRVEPAWAKRFARKAKDRSAKALEPLGYYEPRITTELTRHDSGNYLLTVNVDPGEPVVVTQLEIKISGAGQNESRLVKQVRTFPLHIGDRLQHNLYDEGKGALLETATALGYLDARFTTHEVRVHRAERSAEISLDLDTGPRYYFGKLQFHGADDLPAKILKRYQTFKAGDPFSDSELAKTQSNLADSDKFRTIQVKALRDQSENHEVPIRIDLEPRPRYQLRPGVGYGTDTGPRASLRFKDNNTFKLGHEFLADMLIAERRQSVSGNYLIPLASRDDSIMGFSLQYNNEDNDTYETTAITAEASLTHSFIKGIGSTLYLNLSQEKYTIGGEPTQVTTLMMPGVRISQRHGRFDQPGYIREGYFWQVEVRGSAKTLGSDVSVLQGIIGGTAIYRLTEKTALILHTEDGMTMQNDFGDLPPSMRFFAGGDQSVRGYAYKSLGPKDAEGNTVGGRHLLTGSVEAERALNKNWGLALFYDIGNAFDNFNDYELAQGAGFGVRRYTPIGPIKVDLARQLGNSNNSFRLHLSVGFGW